MTAGFPTWRRRPGFLVYALRPHKPQSLAPANEEVVVLQSADGLLSSLETDSFSQEIKEMLANVPRDDSRR